MQNSRTQNWAHERASAPRRARPPAGSGWPCQAGPAELGRVGPTGSLARPGPAQLAEAGIPQLKSIEKLLVQRATIQRINHPGTHVCFSIRSNFGTRNPKDIAEQIV